MPLPQIGRYHRYQAGTKRDLKGTKGENNVETTIYPTTEAGALLVFALRTVSRVLSIDQAKKTFPVSRDFYDLVLPLYINTVVPHSG